MARTALVAQQITRSGLTPAYTAANVDGHSIPNSGLEFLHVKTVGTPTNITIKIPGVIDGQAVAGGGRVIALGTNTERMIGPFPPNIFDQPGNEVHVDFSAVTAVTCAAVRPS